MAGVAISPTVARTPGRPIAHLPRVRRTTDRAQCQRCTPANRRFDGGCAGAIPSPGRELPLRASAPSLLERIKAWGATLLASATTVDEGLWLGQHGADAVIAQGIEAGGHRGHFLSGDLTGQSTTRDLVGARSHVIGLPVIAVGGISSRANDETLIEAGASAVQTGTAYLLCPEATTPVVHRVALQQAGRSADITNLFAGARRAAWRIGSCAS